MQDRTFAAAEISGQLTAESGKPISTDYVYKAAHSIWPQDGSFRGERFTFEFKTSFCKYAQIWHAKGNPPTFKAYLESTGSKMPRRFGVAPIVKKPSIPAPKSPFTPLEQKILDYLGSIKSDKVPFADIKKALGNPSGSIGTMLRRLFEKGAVVPSGYGYWTLTGPKPKSADAEKVLEMFDNFKKEIPRLVEKALLKSSAVPAMIAAPNALPLTSTRETDPRIGMIESSIAVFRLTHDIADDRCKRMLAEIAGACHPEWTQPRHPDEEYAYWLRKHKHIDTFIRELPGFLESLHNHLERQPVLPL